MFQEVWTHLQKEGKGNGDGFCNFCELLHTFSCIRRKKGEKKELHVLLMLYEDLLEKYDDVLNEHDVLRRDCVTMYNEHNASQSHIEQLQLDVVKVSGVLPRSQMTPTHVLL